MIMFPSDYMTEIQTELQEVPPADAYAYWVLCMEDAKSQGKDLDEAMAHAYAETENLYPGMILENERELPSMSGEFPMLSEEMPMILEERDVA